MSKRRSSGVSRRFSKPKSHIKYILCSICLCSRSSEFFSTKYCSSPIHKHLKRQTCDSCLHQHVISKLYSCLTSSIICSETNCSAYLSQSAICDILSKYKSNDLLKEYLNAQEWQGQSDEWIQRFALRCPGCNVPIEKDGGCDQMICSRCYTVFYWSQQKKYFQKTKKFCIIHPLIDGILFVIFLLFVILSSVIYFKK